MRFPLFDIEPLILQWRLQGWDYGRILARVQVHVNEYTDDPEKRRELMKLANQIVADTLSRGFA